MTHVWILQPRWEAQTEEGEGDRPRGVGEGRERVRVRRDEHEDMVQSWQTDRQAGGKEQTWGSPEERNEVEKELTSWQRWILVFISDEHNCTKKWSMNSKQENQEV